MNSSTVSNRSVIIEVARFLVAEIDYEIDSLNLRLMKSKCVISGQQMNNALFS